WRRDTPPAGASRARDAATARCSRTASLLLGGRARTGSRRRPTEDTTPGDCTVESEGDGGMRALRGGTDHARTLARTAGGVQGPGGTHRLPEMPPTAPIWLHRRAVPLASPRQLDGDATAAYRVSP